jgi:hypothetical protein
MAIRVPAVKALACGGPLLLVAFLACSTGAPVAEAPASAADASTGNASIPCGRALAPCGAEGPCEGAPDCASGLCRDGRCRATAPADGAKNGDETDVDCGGTKAPACGDGKGCATAADCTSSVCKGEICQAPSPTDGIKNGDESDVDCGGKAAPTCAVGRGCAATPDCERTLCDDATKRCLPPSATDGIKNGDETDIDCGGPGEAPRCQSEKACTSTSDCANVLCDTTAKVCAPPANDDGLRNGSESDVDCGGDAPTNARRCKLEEKCVAGTDCASGGCSTALGNRCSVKSCGTGEVAGITSCGAKETGEVGAVHESCCKSLVLPTRVTRRLDKYEITSGRFRTFLAAIGAGGNVRAWVTAFAAANPTSQLGSLLRNFPVVKDLYPAVARANNLSLVAHMTLDIDNYNGIRGCANYDGAYSANTYWMDYQVDDFGLPKRSLPRAVSDEKPLNCAMPIMFAAFCAWDGGELATYDDYLDVWTEMYPWGATDLRRPNYNHCNGPFNNGGFKCQCDGVNNIGPNCPAGGFTAIGEAGVFYEFPRNTNRSKDNEPLIAAPGRFVTDASTRTSNGERWYDLYGNLAEYTGDFAVNPNTTLRTFCDLSAAPAAGATTCTRTEPGAPPVTKGPGTLYTDIPQIGMIGASWEGHVYGKTGKASNLPATFQYGKFGARCVRPAAE